MPETTYTVRDITRITKGNLVQWSDESAVVSRLLIDSRRLASSDETLFFALVSKRNDGHRYIAELYEKGVRNFVVQQEPENLLLLHEANIVLVKDTLMALQALAAYHRKQFSMPVIGITGSNGKTIVKEWLYQLLSEDYSIVRSPKSFNSQVGVPLSVWQMAEDNDLAIFEAGISEQDEMDHLQAIIQPTIGIFTNLGHAHDENFINRLQKAGEKLKLFSRVDTLIYCTDHKELHESIIRSGILRNINAFTWSRYNPADLKVVSVNHSGGSTTIAANYREESISVTIPFTDEASTENAIHCWAAMLVMGIDIGMITARMKQLQPLAMRLEMKEGVNNCTLINDSYSNDIDSLSIALDFLLQQKQHKKKTIILSDILQSGRSDTFLYTEIAQLLASKKIDRLIGIGKAISKQAAVFGNMEKLFFQSTSEFLNSFSLSGFNNESILLKGARIFEFERISEALQQKTHDTVLEINLNALIHNLNYYRSKLPAGVKLMVMVKAFSYGSGSFEIANKLQFHSVDYLTVAYADEGVELRKAGISLPIMVMNPDEESFDSIFKYRLEPEIYSFRSLRMLKDALEATGNSHEVNIHVKIDTGMRRLGFEPDEVEELMSQLRGLPHVKIQSVFSHLAGSDDPELDFFTHQQIALFKEACLKIEGLAGYPFLRHIANTAAISRFPESSFDMVRLGIGLYGIAPIPEEQKNLMNVSTLKSVISQIKVIKAGETVGYNRSWQSETDGVIGIVPIGYADGFSRVLSNGKGKLKVNGHIVPVIGNVCMDMTMVNLTGVPAKEGDEVIVFGKEMPLTDLATDMGTIPYEILTGISRRVKRIYFEE